MAKQIFTSEQLKQIYGTPQVQQQVEPEKKSGIQNVVNTAKSLAGGFASGVGGVALTAEDYLARKAVNAFGSEQMKQNLANAPKLQEQFNEQMGGNESPTAYSVGQLGGEIASLSAPVGAVGKLAGKGAGAVGLGNTGQKIVQAGAEGVAFTAGQGLMEGEKQSLKDFALNAGINMVFPAAGAVAKKIGENAPSRIINSLIKPLQKDFAYGKNPGKTVAELGITANDFDGLIAGIKNAKTSVGENIGTLIQKSLPQLQSRIDLNTLVSPIDEAIKVANKSPRTNANVISRLESVKADLVDNINSGIDPQSFKGLVGDLTRWTGNASDDAIVNKSLKQVYGKTASSMDDVLKNTLTPEEFAQYKKASEQYGNLISAENAASYRDKILERQDLVSFGAKNTALIGALTTAVATGGSGISTIIAGIAGAGIDKAMATPAFKTRLAKLLSKLAPKDVQTFFDKVPAVKQIYNQKQLDNLMNKAEGYIKNPKAGASIQDVSKTIDNASDPLLQEAKKYKSAEEFVNALKKEVSEKFGIENPSQKSIEDWFIAKQKGIIGGAQKELVEATLNGEKTGWKTFSDASKDLIDSHFGDNSTEIVTVYRGVNPKETKFVNRKLYNGDFVTGKKQYAQQYGKVSEYKINKKDLIYAPDGKEILVANGLNPIKKPIPLSQLEEIWKKANKK